MKNRLNDFLEDIEMIDSLIIHYTNQKKDKIGGKMNKMNPLDVGIKNINNFRQNKPFYVAQDLYKLHGVPKEDVLKVLLARGVCKWMAVREQLITYEHDLKKEITSTLEEIVEVKAQKNWYRHQQLKGRIKTLVEIRQNLRDLCHGDRWSSPKKDKYSTWFLEDLSVKERDKWLSRLLGSEKGRKELAEMFMKPLNSLFDKWCLILKKFSNVVEVEEIKKERRKDEYK